MSWKWERRERKRKAQKRRIPKHGKTLAEMYANAIKKKVRNLGKKHLTN